MPSARSVLARHLHGESGRMLSKMNTSRLCHAVALYRVPLLAVSHLVITNVPGGTTAAEYIRRGGQVVMVLYCCPQIVGIDHGHGGRIFDGGVNKVLKWQSEQL